MSQPKEPATSRAPETVPPATDASPPEPLPVHPARLRAEDPLPPYLGVVPLRDLVL